MAAQGIGGEYELRKVGVDVPSYVPRRTRLETRKAIASCLVWASRCLFYAYSLIIAACSEHLYQATMIANLAAPRAVELTVIDD